jgi:hypothetical protein
MPKLRLFLVSMGAGTVMVLFIFGGLLLGVFLEGMLGFAPCLSLLLALAGLIAGAYIAYRLVTWGIQPQW